MHAAGQSRDDCEIPYIRDLANFVRNSWKEQRYHEAALVDVATRAFDQHALPDDLTVSRLLNWALSASVLPQQAPGRAVFGDPPICLHRDERFYIDVYIWRDSTTSIHDHAFSGAFCVLEGSSLQTTYQFETTDDIAPNFRLGRLSRTGCEVLRQGDFRRIDSGARLIHSVFHLEHPSATLCIRSARDTANPIQFRYHHPGVACQAFYEERHPAFNKRLQVIEAACALQDHKTLDQMRRLVQQTDWLERFRIINLVAKQLGTDEAVALIDAIPAEKAQRTECLTAALHEVKRCDEICEMRKQVQNEDTRFLMALLANLHDRQAVLEQLRNRFPDDDPAVKLSELYVDIMADVYPERGKAFEQIHLLNGLALEHLLRDTRVDDVVSFVSQSAAQRGLNASHQAIAMATESVPHISLLRPLFSEAYQFS